MKASFTITLNRAEVTALYSVVETIDELVKEHDPKGLALKPLAPFFSKEVTLTKWSKVKYAVGFGDEFVATSTHELSPELVIKGSDLVSRAIKLGAPLGVAIYNMLGGSEELKALINDADALTREAASERQSASFADGRVSTYMTGDEYYSERIGGMSEAQREAALKILN